MRTFVVIPGSGEGTRKTQAVFFKFLIEMLASCQWGSECNAGVGENRSRATAIMFCFLSIFVFTYIMIFVEGGTTLMEIFKVYKIFSSYV